MTKLLIDGIAVTLQDQRWSCPDPALLEILKSLNDPFGPSGSEPDPDLWLANKAIKRVGGKITEHDEQVYDPSVVY